MKRHVFIKTAIVLMLVVLLGANAYAEEKAKAADAAKLPKLAVKTLTGKGVSDDTASALTEVLCTRLMAKNAYRVLCASDVQAILTATQQTALLGNCDDNKCYEALGKALDAPFIVVGTIGKVGDIYTINLSMINTEEKTAVKRVTHEVKGKEDDLVKGVREAVEKLLK